MSLSLGFYAAVFCELGRWRAGSTVCRVVNGGGDCFCLENELLVFGFFVLFSSCGAYSLFILLGRHLAVDYPKGPDPVLSGTSTRSFSLKVFNLRLF